MLKKKSKLIFLSIVIIILLFFVGKNFYKKALKKNMLSSSVESIDLSQRKLKKIKPIFEMNGLKEIALVTMVKNEEDIIFENLVWHFCIGFRKFVIVDNLSTDNTRQKIEEFILLTKNNAKVFVIDDPIFEYIQSRITTGAYDFARSVWPEVKWIFPVDADEFWIPEKRLSETLAQLPNDIETISVVSYEYHPSFDYYSFAANTKFYEKLHYRAKKEDNDPKIAIRSLNNVKVGQGNHVAHNINDNKRLKSIDGELIGLYMYEYPFRSVVQVHAKYSNGMRVNKEAKKIGAISEGMGVHWEAYEKDLEKDGRKAAEKKFQSFFKDSNNSLDDPLSINSALEAFYKLVNSSKE